MAGSVWYWLEERNAAATMPGLRAWIDGKPGKGDAVIVCGEARLPEDWRSGSGGEPLVLNAGAADFAAMGGEEARRRLREAGLEAAPEMEWAFGNRGKVGERDNGRHRDSGVRGRETVRAGAGHKRGDGERGTVVGRAGDGNGERERGTVGGRTGNRSGEEKRVTVVERESIRHSAQHEERNIAMSNYKQAACYAVSLFELRPIAIIRRSGYTFAHKGGLLAAGSERLLEPANSRYKRFVRMAAAALYALGLDTGVVLLRTAENGKPAIADVALPDAAMLSGGIWKEAAAGLAAELAAGDSNAGSIPGSKGKPAGEPNRQNGILIGADPEFLLIGPGGKVVPAIRYLAGGHGVGCDAVLAGGRVVYPVAELRPAPASMPGELAANIRRLLAVAAGRIGDESLRWAAGGMPAPGFALGGHIHLSGVRLTARLLRQLDSYVALPLAMVETAAERARRPRFGKLGDFRLQPHGGFEYRTPPSWLVSPMAAKAAFALSLLCAMETDSLHYRPSEEAAAATAYYCGDRETLRIVYLPRLAESLQKTSSYAGLADYIEPLLEAASRGAQWAPSADLRSKWRIGNWR